MFVRISFICFVLVIFNTEAFVNGDSTANQPNVLESFQRNMEEFRKCLDQVFAKSADEINTKQIQPIFEVLGDKVNRFSKVFEDLTAPRSTKSPFDK